MGHRDSVPTGLNFKELYSKAKQHKLEVRDERKIYLVPPSNVWRHLSVIPGPGIYVNPVDEKFFCLELLKAMHYS